MVTTRNPGRYAGVLYVLTSIVGFFAMGYVPNHLIVSGNATATVNNIVASQTLYRFGIAAQLVSGAGFIFVALALYDLLNGVDRRQAAMMVILIVVSIPITFLNEVNSVAALLLARGSDFLGVIDKPQRDALAMLFIKLHGRGLSWPRSSGASGSFPLGFSFTGRVSYHGFSASGSASPALRG
jgi:hypothetical protein